MYDVATEHGQVVIINCHVPHGRIFLTSQTPPPFFAPLFGGVGGKIHRTQQHNTNKGRQQVNQPVCTLQNNSKVPASRELWLECTPQQHTKCAQGEGKATRLLLGVTKNKES